MPQTLPGKRSEAPPLCQAFPRAQACQPEQGSPHARGQQEPRQTVEDLDPTNLTAEPSASPHKR